MFHEIRMDWNFAIERQRERLLLLVMELFAKIGLSERGGVERLPKPLYRFVLWVLRGAESAVRRLIFTMASNIVVEPRPKRPFPKGRVIARKDKDKDQGPDQDKGRKKRGPSFKLFDPTKREHGRRRRKSRKSNPRARYIDYDPRIPEPLRSLFLPPPPAPVPEVAAAIDDGTVDAASLCRRLFAIVGALQDLPRQAMRLARWQARPAEERRPQRESPLRSGRPPGWRSRSTHEVHEILKECHWLARNVQPALDTS